MGATNQYKLKYQTFDQLMDKVMDEFEMYDKNQLIEPSSLIKVVKKINKKLGLRITTTKDVVIPFEDYFLKLPNDMEKLNYAVVCGSYQIHFGNSVSGEHREAKELQCGDDTSTVFESDCGVPYIIVKTDPQKGQSIKYPLKFNLPIEDKRGLSSNKIYGYVKGDFLKIEGIREGNLYINYESVLEDEEGNLLVLDHDIINDYYEYAIKRRILENVYLNGEESAMSKLNLIEPRYREAKSEATSIVNTPDFKEFQDTLDLNRVAAHKRFYSFFTNV